MTESSQRDPAAEVPLDPTVPTSQRVLATAARLFRRHGYTGTSTRQLSTALGIQRSSLYHHTASKQQLLFEVCTTSLERISKEVAEEVAGIDDPGLRVYAALKKHLIVAISDMDLHSAMLINVHSLTDRYHSTVIMMRDQYQHWLEALVEDAQRAGALRADIPARYQTLAILNLLNWTIFWYDPHGPISPEQLASWLRDIAFNGVGMGVRGLAEDQPPRSATTASVSS